MLFGMLMCQQLHAQSRAELEKQRKMKEVQIALTKKLLAETGEKQKKTFEYLNILQQQIKAREELIGTLQNEVHVLDMGISRESDVVMALESDLASLKKEYAQLVYVMYKNRNAYSMLSFVFASTSFNDLVKRVKLIQFYSSYRAKQMDLIVRTENSLGAKIADLQSTMNAKEIVMGNLGDQKQNLEEDKTEQDQLAQELQGQEQKLMKQLKENERAAAKLDKAIHDIIAKEMAANTKKSPSGKTVSSGKREDYGLTPEATKLSNEFASNKSRLPWPVERGYIAEGFGQHEHPRLKGVMINNNGVKIRTTKDATARAIFQGEVRAVVKIGQGNYSVILAHGRYFTVYSNLSDVVVHQGEKISTRDALGTVAEDPEDGNTELELQIWQTYDKLDPQGWLKKD
jgi:septal ring factor EnvC (AmiA/AmiB activator)